jgi:hypothetical protein
MNAERYRKIRDDGMLTLLTLGAGDELPSIQSLQDFCDTRRLSLRSRLELAEHVCSLVSAAHDTGSGFLRISSRTVNVEYVDGGLSIDIPGAIAIARSRDGERSAFGTGRFSAGQLVRAANVVELGQMVADLTGRTARLDDRLRTVIERATSMQTGYRLDSVVQLRDEIAHLRRACEACSNSTPALAAEGAERSFAQRWSWAD